MKNKNELPLTVLKFYSCFFSSSLEVIKISGYLSGKSQDGYGNNIFEEVKYVLILDQNKKELGRCFKSNNFVCSKGNVLQNQEKIEFHFLGMISTIPSRVNVIFVHDEKLGQSNLTMRGAIDITDIDSLISPDVLSEVQTCQSETPEELLKRGKNLYNKGFWKLSLFIYALALQRIQHTEDEDDYLSHLTIIADLFKRQNLAPIAVLLLRKHLPRKIDMSQWEKSAYPHVFDYYCRLLGYSQEVEEFCQQELILNGESYWLNTNLGHLTYNQQDRNIADSYYLTASRFLISKKTLNFHGNRGIMTWRSIDFVKFLDKIDLDNCLQLLPRQVDISIDELSIKPDIVHLLACDDQYFEKFGEIVVNSSISNADIDHLVIHLHIINPSQKTIKYIEALQSNHHSKIKINRTFEYINSELCDKAYYTCLRFLIAPILLRKYNCGILITEVDAKIIANWSKILHILKDKEVCLSNEEIFHRLYPWSAAAAILYFSTSEFSIRMADLIAKYIAIVFDFNAIAGGNWVIDQVAIGQSIDFLGLVEDTQAKIKFLQLKQILLLANYFEGGKQKFIQKFKEKD